MTYACVLISHVFLYQLNETFVFSFVKAFQDGKDFELMLIETLTKNYKIGARPVHSNKEPVVVYYDLKINKLEKLVNRN